MRPYVRSFRNVSILPLNSIEMSEELAVKYIEKSDLYVLCPTIDIHKRSTYHMNMEGGISMIVDSHAHYNNNAYKKPFRYLSYDKDGYTLKEGELPHRTADSHQVQ